MNEDLERHSGALFRDYSLRVSNEERPLTSEELQQVNDAINTLRAGQRTSCYLERSIREGVAVIHDHFRFRFGLSAVADYSALLEYARARKYFADLNPSWDSREPRDVEFMAFGHLGVYDYARSGHLEFP